MADFLARATGAETQREALAMRRTGWLALAAGITYCATTTAGSLLDRSYSQLAQPISDLTATGAPTRAALVLPYVLYNLLCFAFAIGVYRASARDRLFKVGLALLTINAVAGIMMVTWCPEDRGGELVSSAGIGHVVFASVSSVAVVAGAIVYGFAFRHSARWRPLSPFSIAVGGAFVVLGPIAAIAIATKSRLGGLAERGPIGLFILWLLIVGGYALLRSQQRGGEPTERGAKPALGP